MAGRAGGMSIRAHPPSRVVHSCCLRSGAGAPSSLRVLSVHVGVPVFTPLPSLAEQVCWARFTGVTREGGLVIAVSGRPGGAPAAGAAIGERPGGRREHFSPPT